MPNSITLAAIGVKAKLISLGLDAADAMEVPTSGTVVDWFNSGSTPGEIGPAVILGRVENIIVFAKSIKGQGLQEN